MALVGTHLDTTIFIISTGRTGTAAIASYLNQGFTGVQAFHEPKPSFHLRFASNAYQAGKLSDRRMITLLRHTRQWQCARLREPVYVEANPYLYGFAKLLPRIFARPRLVHIVRDPRTYVRSAVNFGALRGLKRACAAWMPHWIAKPEYVEPASLLYSSQMTPTQRFAWGWRFCNEFIEQASPLYGDDYLRLRFEDLFHPNGEGIRQLAAWIGLSEISGQSRNLLTQKINPSIYDEVTLWDSWPEAEQRNVLAYCGPLMARYGYAE